jgi:predicted NBD/HSP70 family sugar kinase
VSTNPTLGRESTFQEMGTVINDLRSRWGSKDLAGIGFGVPSLYFAQRGSDSEFQQSGIPRGFSFLRRNGAALGTKFILENDANAVVLGEKWMHGPRTSPRWHAFWVWVRI